MVLGNSLMSFRALRVVGCQGAKPPKGADRWVSRVLRAAYLRILAEAAHDSGMMSPAIPDADGRIAPAASRPTCRGIPHLPRIGSASRQPGRRGVSEQLHRAQPRAV
jgi:hypothetical protein